MPKIWEQIGAGVSERTYDAAATFGVLPANVTIQKGENSLPKN